MSFALVSLLLAKILESNLIYDDGAKQILCELPHIERKSLLLLFFFLVIKKKELYIFHRGLSFIIVKRKSMNSYGHSICIHSKA